MSGQTKENKISSTGIRGDSSFGEGGNRIKTSGIIREKKEDKPASLLTFFGSLNVQLGFSKFMPLCL